MKIAVLALCVVLPSICLCTPLPDTSVTAGAQSGASVNGNGNGPVTVDANAQANAGVHTGGNPPAAPAPTTPPAVPQTPPATPSVPPAGTPPSTGTTVDAQAQAAAGVHQQGGNGGPVDANASSGASASVTVSGNKCGKPDVPGFDKYVGLVRNQGDMQKLASVNWMLWKSSSTSTAQIQEVVCAPRYWDQRCKASQFKITVQSETDILFEVWGLNGEKVLYIKETLSVTSQQFHVYTSQVVAVAEAANGSQEVIAVQNDQSIKQLFDNGAFILLDTDYQTYLICTTSGENSVTFVSVSQQVYESVELKQQISQKVDQVLQVNNLSSVQFVEATNKFEVDIHQFKWDQVNQCGAGNGAGPGTNVDVNANSGAGANVHFDGSGAPGAPQPGVQAGANSGANVHFDGSGAPGAPQPGVQAGANSGANVHVDGGGAPGAPQTGVQAGANSGANVNVNGGQGGGNCNGDKPTQQGFTNYSVMKVRFDEFTNRINEKTWYVAKYTQSQEDIKSDVTVCTDRYISSNCVAVKFQYVTENGSLVVKEWGCDDSNLIYVQEKITQSTSDFIILKPEVVNVMKATKDTNVAVGVDNKDQVTTYLSSEFAVLHTDFQSFFIGQTSSDKGAITFVAYAEQIYGCEEKQQPFDGEISQILQRNGIDESKLQKLTQQFITDTNKYNKVSTETDVSKDGQSVTTKQQTEQEGSGGKTATETTIQNGPPGSPTTVDANANSGAGVHTGGGAPGSPTTVDANANSGAGVHTGGGAPGSPTTVDANANSGAGVHTGGGAPGSPTTVDANANSGAGVHTGGGAPGSPTTVDANATSGAGVNVNNTPAPAGTPPTGAPPTTVTAGAQSGANVSVQNPPNGPTTVTAGANSGANVTAN